MHIPLTVWYTFRIGIENENLFNNQELLDWVFIVYFLITSMFDSVVVMCREIRCWSFSGVKGWDSCHERTHLRCKNFSVSRHKSKKKLSTRTKEIKQEPHERQTKQTQRAENAGTHVIEPLKTNHKRWLVWAWISLVKSVARVFK